MNLKIEEKSNQEEIPLEYRLFGLAFKQLGAIQYFAENLPSNYVGKLHGQTGIHEFYNALLHFHEKTGLDPIDPIAFRSWLESETGIYEALGGSGGVKVFLDLVMDVELSTPESVVKVIRHKANKRMQMDHLQELQTLLAKKGHKSDEEVTQINDLTEQIRSLENDLDIDPLASVTTANDISLRADKLMKLPDFLSTPFKELNRAMSYTEDGGFFRGAVHAIIAPSGKGKALALDTPIPTPQGWTKMEDLEVGSEILGSDGLSYEVTKLSPIFTNHDCYNVTFSDGTNIVADADHQWEIEHRSHWSNSKVKTTKELSSLIGRGSIRVPIQSALKLSEANLLIDPYTLGVWLGDGHSASSRITSADNQIISEIAKAEKIRHVGELLYSLTDGNGSGNISPNSFSSRLNQLNLLNNKHIPTLYLRASIDQRLALLQGLMDSDGSVFVNGNNIALEFSVTRKSLAYDTIELIRSLGITASIREGKASLYGKDCGTRYRIRFLTTLPVFRLERKLNRQLKNISSGYRRTIRSIEPINSVLTRCIEVNSPDHLYLAGEGMVPTHNSTFAKCLMNDWVNKGYTVLYINFEEASAHWETILFTQIIGQNVYAHAEEWTFDEREKHLHTFRSKLAEWGNRFMVRHDPDTSYFSDLEIWLRDIMGHNERVPDVVIIDTIQSLIEKGKGARWAEFEHMMIRLEKLARDMNSVFIITAQQNTEAMKEKREMIKQSDTGGSIAIQQKSSVTIFITEKRLISGDESDDDCLMQLQIPKNRITGASFMLDPPVVRYHDESKSYLDFDKTEINNMDYNGSSVNTYEFGDFNI